MRVNEILGRVMLAALVGLLIGQIAPKLGFAGGCGGPQCGSPSCGMKVCTHGCSNSGCSRCCAKTETIVIHCPGEKSTSGRSVPENAQRPISQPSLISPSYNLASPMMMQSSMAMPMPMPMAMPMAMPMPMYGGNSPVNYQQRNALPENANRDNNNCSTKQLEKRLDQLEVDVENMGNQMSELVNSVERNTKAVSLLYQKFKEKFEEGNVEQQKGK